MLFANLRGLREAGKIFAVPTYFYVASLGTVILIGLVKGTLGMLHPQALPSEAKLGMTVGTPGSSVFASLGIFFLLKAFANGGVSLTGLEAISNSVSAFRKPVARNARTTLICMCFTLGFLVLGTSLIANWTHAVPYGSGTPTVVSQEVHLILGGGFGNVLFYVIQMATVLILFTGGNTSFNGFPYLASFVATDGFLPRQLTKRGHRLVFSNGILILGAIAIALDHRLQSATQCVGRPLCDRRIYRVRHRRCGHGQAPPAGTRKTLAPIRCNQRLLCNAVVLCCGNLICNQVQRRSVADCLGCTTHVLRALTIASTVHGRGRTT